MIQTDNTWGHALGEDPAKITEKIKSKGSKNTALGLMYYFTQSIPLIKESTTNSLALMKTFKQLRTDTYTYDDIYKMIDRFFYETKVKPLPNNVEYWQAFIKQKDELCKWVTQNSFSHDVSEWK